MALPSKLDRNIKAGDETVTTGLNEEALPSKLDVSLNLTIIALEEILGIPDATLISNPMGSFAAAGLISLIFQDNGGDPASVGQLVRNGSDLVFHDGVAPRTIVTTEGGGISDPTFTRNIGLTASIVGSDVSFNLVAADGTDQSTSNISQIAFRNDSASLGTIQIASMTAFASFTLSDGSTLGIGAASTGRVYLYAGVESGAVKLCMARQGLFEESALQSTTAEGGAGAADSNTVLYAASTITDIPVRLVGIAEMTAGAVAGSWETKPQVLSMWHTGMRKTGDVVQHIHQFTNTSASTTTLIPADDTPPLISEGDQVLTQAFTPTNGLNRLTVRAAFFASASTADSTIYCLFKDAQTDSISTKFISANGNGNGYATSLDYTEIPGATTAITWSLRFGAISSKGYFGEANAAFFGGTMFTMMEFQEITV